MGFKEINIKGRKYKHKYILLPNLFYRIVRLLVSIQINENQRVFFT